MRGALVTSIQAVAVGKYAVTFAVPDGSHRDYVFTVDDADDILVVNWSTEFAGVLGPDIARAQVVYQAVMAVHKACTSEIDLDADRVARHP
jgi:hypothetical protein